MVKIKEREDCLKTRCAVCWQVLRPKSPLLHGMKSMKYEIRKKLKHLLPPKDFETLYNEKVFTNPRICNMCFVAIRRIPQTIAKLEGLLGKTINTRLYKPQRPEWSETVADSLQTGLKRHTFPRDCKLLSTLQRETSSSSGDVTASSEAGQIFDRAAESRSQPSGTKPPETFKDVNHDTDGDNDDDDPPAIEDEGDNVEVDESSHISSRQQKVLKTSVNCVEAKKVKAADTLSSPQVFDNLLHDGDQVPPITDDVLSKIKHEDPTRMSTHKKCNKTKMQVGAACSKIEENEKRSRKSRQCKDMLLKYQQNNATDEQTRGKSSSQTSKESKSYVTLRRARRTTRLAQESRNAEDEQTSDVSYSDGDDEYVPPSSKTVRDKSLQKSAGVHKRKRGVHTQERVKDLSLHKISLSEVALTNQKNGSRKLKTEFTQLKSQTSKITNIDLEAVNKNNSLTRVKNKKNKNNLATIIKSEVPGNVSEHSKMRLIDLENQVKIFIDCKRRNIMKVLIMCAVSGCDHVYPLWRHLAVHIKYFHYDGAQPAEDDFTQKMFMLAEGDGQLDHEKYPFQCRYTDCHLAFTKEESLKEHELVHGSHLFMCGFPDCTKAFKTAKSLQVHFKCHTGEKPHRCDTDRGDKISLTVSELTDHRSSHDLDQSLCCDVCGRRYLNDESLVRHRRRIHGVGKPGRHKCTYEGCNQSFVKKEKLEIHVCSHSPERKLFCEKCGKKFSCQRYLDVHYKIHIKNESFATNPPPRSIKCDIPECGKMFTTRENMKSHVLNQHRGRKPKSVPGVFFPCAVAGCGRKFSFRSTLYRHNKLVHKGGDYRLGRAVVRYVCKYEGCTLEFNRKNLLEEHMVMEHGKTPKRLLPLQNKELDFVERLCAHCGMALTVSQLSRHEEIYHSDRAIKEMKETPPYTCHLKGCEQSFNTREDRRSHVQEHIDSPPFRCRFKDCQMTFFLEKNLDNHLCSHSLKVSTCDYQGCSLTFDDQYQLAKHSKTHYNGKMKCPWPNCDNWLTETGHLKPHFIAHSRSLLASLDSDFICDICELAFSSKWGLMIHKRMHGEEAAGKPTVSKLAKFSCEQDGCKATFSDQKGFFDHFLFHFTNKACTCTYQGCSESFHNMVTLSRHTKCHYGGKFQCPWQGCPKIFASVFVVKKHLFRHIISNSEVANNHRHSCSQCFMVFRLEENLQSHQEHHNEKSDYVCPTCGKEGRHNHMKVHRLGNRSHKSHKCQQCGFQYATISGLKFHLLQKHKLGKWPFKCSFCGKGFVSSREMQRHLPSHTKEKPFTCEICGRRFASHTGHRGHMRKHRGERYVCDVEGCGKVYSTSFSLRGHKAQHEGFSKTCHFCFKTFRNPYGHKCKAGTENKKKLAKLGQSQVIRSFTVLAPNLTQPAPAPPQQQTSLSTLAPVAIPTTSSMQHMMIMPQQMVTHALEAQQTTRTIPHCQMSHSLGQGSQDLPPGLQQVIPHGLSSQDLMQDRGQSGPMDMTRGAAVDVTGEYTFNNYIVLWDSPN